MKILSGFERLLLFFGVLLVALYGVARCYSALYSYTAVRSFRRNQAASKNAPVNPVQLSGGIPDFHLWSPKRIEEYQIATSTSNGAPLGVLKISSVGIEVPVLEGTDDLTLNRGAGHIEGTSTPGEEGNIGIAAHRDGFFRGLKDVHVGDVFDVYTEKGNTRYVVDDIRIVPPEDVSVLEPGAKPSVTLVTCFPFYFVGSAPLRYIVHASTAETKNLKASSHANTLGQVVGRE